jgi:S1-C subfamily serine protease
MFTASGKSRDTATELINFQVRRSQRQAQSGRPYSVLDFADSLFRISDRDRNGFLTRQEATKQYIKNRFAHYDVDNDGRVTFVEHRLGFKLEHLDDGRPARKMGVGRDNVTDRQGFVVGLVLPSAPAEKAGVKIGDRILQIDGEKIETLQDLRRAVNSGGRIQKVVIEREEKRITLQLEFPY